MTAALRGNVDALLQALRANSDEVTRSLPSARPEPGPDLREVPYVPYWLAPGRPQWSGVTLIPLLPADLTSGVLGIEIVSPRHRIIWQDTLPLSQLASNTPVHFDFPPILESYKGNFELRVYVRDALQTVHVLEYRLLTPVSGARRWRVQPLCGLRFDGRRPDQPATGGNAKWHNHLSPELAAFVGSSSFEDHYWTSGWQTANVQLITDLEIDDSLIDIGCGVGRLAHGLYGWYQGRYVGVDIVADLIEYCRRKFPKFEFHHLNLQSNYYNPRGELDTPRLTMPVESNSFDVAVLMSVYTHLLPDRVQQMTAEVSRVLKPNGRCLATFFILDNQLDNAMFSFQHPVTPFCRVEKVDAPEFAVGYDRAFIETTFERNGLKLSEFYRGSWTGSGKLGPQDQILFKKSTAA